MLMQFANLFGGKINKPIDFQPQLNLAPFMSIKVSFAISVLSLA